MMRWGKRKLVVKDLLDIDEGRVSRSKPLKVKLTQELNLVKEDSLIGKVLRFFKLKKAYYFYKLFKYEVKSDSGKKYTTLIRVSPSFDVNKFLSNEVQVFCTCPDFMYRGAYELKRVGSLVEMPSTIKHLGDAVKVAPTRVTTTPICKHLYATLGEFKRQAPNLIVRK